MNENAMPKEERRDTCFLTSVFEYGNEGASSERFILSCDSCGASLDELTYEDLHRIEQLLHDFIQRREAGRI